MKNKKNKIGFFVALGIILFNSLNAQIDTTGLRFYRPLYNSMKTWDEGAFNMNQKGHPDYGWGVYNSLTHGLSGSTTYLLKLPSGSVKKIFITSKNSIGNIYNFNFSDIDGSNLINKEIRCVDYSTNPKKLFIYYSIQNNLLIDREPVVGSWDFVLTRFHENNINYNVTGILLNENIKANVYKATDEARALSSTLADTTAFSDSLSVIGNSWYSLNGMVIEPNKKNVYFLKTDSDTIYRMIVNFFESGASGAGRVGIQKQLLRPSQGAWVYDTLVMGSGYANDVYYHLQNETVTTVLRNNWDLAFKINQMSASIIANTTIGSTLYTYPNWNPISVQSFLLNPVEIYPNPSNGLVKVSNSDWDLNSEVKIQIYNIKGQAILSGKQTVSGRELSFDFTGYPTGFYQLRIENKGKIFSGRVLITR